MRTARLLIPLAALALLAGCAADTEEAEPTPEETRADEVRVKDDTDADAPEPADDDAAPSGDLATCILGEWTVDPAVVEENARIGMGPSADAYGATVDVTGTQVAEIGPDTLTTRFEDQRITITMDIDGVHLETVTTLAGETVARYTLDGSVMTVLTTDMSGITTESLTYVDGVETEIPGYAEQMDSAMAMTGSLGGSAHVTCTATTFTQVPLVAGTAIPDMASTLTRR